jgi:hypothetical protein
MIPRKETEDADMEINFNGEPIAEDELELLTTKLALLKRLAVRFGGSHK